MLINKQTVINPIKKEHIMSDYLEDLLDTEYDDYEDDYDDAVEL